MMRLHYSLTCECFRGIPIPRPSRVDTDATPQEIATEPKTATVACPYCGLVSVYSESDVRETPSPRPDPFEAGEYRLFSMSIECDDTSCVVPVVVHRILAGDKGNAKLTFAPKSPEMWRLSPLVMRECVHPLTEKWKERSRLSYPAERLW